MSIPNQFFTVSPRVFPAHKETVITLHGLPTWQRRPSQVIDQGEIQVTWIAKDGLDDAGNPADWGFFNNARTRVKSSNNDDVAFALPALEEGEISCRLVLKEADGTETILAEFSLYAAEADLMELRPWRGDLHQHSGWSVCGTQDESPLTLAIRARERGLDFTTITDHMQMRPSLQAQTILDKFETEFHVVPGEEIHILPEKRENLIHQGGFQPWIHLINFGPLKSVAEYQNEHFDEFNNQVSKAADKLDNRLSEKLRYLMAASDWVFDKIREFGGVSVFAHPFWQPNLRYNHPFKATEYVMRSGKYDAIEVFGMGQNSAEEGPAYHESNMLALAYWQEECLRQKRTIPLVGSTDTHNSVKVVGPQTTIVFAPSNDTEDLQDAIRQAKCVAVIAYPGTKTCVYGPFRYVKYTYFLLREFYPFHDSICEADAKMISDTLNGYGEPSPIPTEQLEDFRDEFWGEF